MVNTKKFSEFAAASLTTTTKKMAGISNTSGGENIIVDFTVEWTTSTRPSPPYDGLLGYNTDLKQYEYYDGTTAAWVQLADNAVFVNAKFIVQQPNAALPAAQALSALTTGILKSTTTTGVVSISAPLTSIDGLTTASDLMIYTTASNVYATTALTAFARTLLAGTTAAAMRSTLGLGQAAVKNVTDNTKPNVASVTGSFVVNHVLLAGDTAGTVKDGGSPAGMGTVLEVDTGTGLTGGPITTTGTISFASIAANSLWVNNTAGAAVPAVTSLAALTEVDDTNVTMTLGGTPSTALINAVSMTLGWTGTLSPTRGGTGVADPTAHGIMVAEGASAMTPIVLSSGQILIGSTGVDPVAAAINSGTSVLVANGAGSITVGLAPIASHDILANITGGSAAPIANTLTATIDAAIGSTQGNILYRNSTVWTVLAPGTSGQLLSTGGAAANPAWTISTFPATGGAAGNILISNGTNYIASTSLWPNTVGSAGTILRSNGTSNAYTTSTFADTYGVSTLLYASSANTVTGLATANSAGLLTNSSGVPAWVTATGTGAPVLGTGPTISSPVINNIKDSSGNIVTSFNSNALAVNYLQLSSSTAGNAVDIASLGTDTNITITMTAKGNGGVLVRPSASTTSPFGMGNGTYIFTHSIPTMTAARTLTYPDANVTLVGGTVLTKSSITAPTVQKFTSGSGTYTTAAGVLYIRVVMVGAGGGGGGGGANSPSAATDGGTGGNTSFGTTLLVANGGGGGAAAVHGTYSAGGTASLGSGPIGIALSGGNGSAGSGYLVAGYQAGVGGVSSALGGQGGGQANNVGTDGLTNTGSGAAGGGTNAAGGGAGGGGAAGGYINAIISSPSATYAYAVGAGGAAGTAGTNGFNGGTGAAGQITVFEYYQ